MICVTLLRAMIIPSHGMQTLSGNPEVNRGPEGNHGPKGNCERGRIEAGHFGSCNPKCPASIQPCQYFVDRCFFFVFHTN